MDRLQSMRVFDKVVEQGSFTRAAQLLDLSSAAVTRHVAELENHLGTRLLNRSTRKLSLTETGQAYLERVRQILPEIDEAEAIASSQSKRPNGTLKLYSQQGFGQYELSRLLPLYAQEFPDVTLDATLSDRTVDMVEEGFDIGIFTGLQKFDASMIVRQLGITEVSLWASPDYITRHGAPETPQDLSNHVCLSFALAHLRHHWSIKGPEGETEVEITNKVTANNGDLLNNCAAAGMGIVLRPSYTMSNAMESGRLTRLLPDHHISKIAVMMVYPSRRLLSATVRSFVDFMTRQFPQPESDPWRGQ
ncbi:LysR family transcriptional regulator [Herbaspirillum sp. RTI4]|uniref:LysR family transcriptional regulator n=1 Tax=Herbaspirillum sp. RTI4 TaxID=3048640 RepID=UPI002AB40C2D|nr:LysR family transcriptional regulator [Herbaspirillum sp. RTI4]MDY7578421.1 LysR family transcriptional regulator [Herbaspirillum sp. RTI4]MEA9982565.1 LysR family transcriptional regulator [Herbaspirillum sp. RTI4]